MLKLATRRVPTEIHFEWLKTLPPSTRLAFHGDSAARAAVLPAWGPAFSETACRAHVQGSRATLWLGPDEYLLLDSSVDAAGIEPTASLRKALAHTPHALVDISHRQFALEIRGPHAAEILNGACPLDLDLAAFPIDMCTRTVFAKADVVLWRTGSDVFQIEVWRSFSGYLTGVLQEIALEFYPIL